VYKQSVIRSSLISSGKISVCFTPFAMSLIAQVISSLATKIFKEITHAHVRTRIQTHTQRERERERDVKIKVLQKGLLFLKLSEI